MCTCIIVLLGLVLESSHEWHNIISSRRQVGNRHDVLSSTDAFKMWRNRFQCRSAACGSFTLIPVCQAHAALCCDVFSDIWAPDMRSRMLTLDCHCCSLTNQRGDEVVGCSVHFFGTYKRHLQNTHSPHECAAETFPLLTHHNKAKDA